MFSWIAKLFLGAAQDGANTVLKDEIEKVHGEIADAISPMLSTMPSENQQEALKNITEVAKKAAVAYAEAYINAHMPTIPTPPPAA